MAQAARRDRMHTSPPRLTRLPAIRQRHTPRVSVHGAGHTPRPHEHPHRAPHSYPRYDTPHAARFGAWRRPHAATACTPPHHAPHSYPRYDGATCRTYRCMAQAIRRDRMPSPPRPAQLPAIPRRHTPHVSVHDASPHASTARAPPHRAPDRHTLRSHHRRWPSGRPRGRQTEAAGTRMHGHPRETQGRAP